ncbi:hypothetical protein J4450_01820 [Candidatus Micrarchaeota archaeon]|nr:hypothetical protein [Candidatus Micrarchaeota archaeon]
MKFKLFFVFLALFVSYLMAAIVSTVPKLSYNCDKEVLVVTALDYDGGTVRMLYSCSSNSCQNCLTTSSQQETVSTNINGGIAEFEYKKYGAGAYNFVIESSGKAPYTLSPSDKTCYDPTATCPKKDIIVETAPICEEGSSSLRVAIKDSLTKNAIKDATVTVNGVDYKTNALGVLKTSALEQGIHELAIDKKGYDKKTVSIDYGTAKYACPDYKIDYSCKDGKVKFTSGDLANKKLSVKRVDSSEDPPKLTSAIGTAGEASTTASFANTVTSGSVVSVRSVPNVNVNNVRVTNANVRNVNIKSGKLNNVVLNNLRVGRSTATFVDQSGTKKTIVLENVRVNGAVASNVPARDMVVVRGTFTQAFVSSAVHTEGQPPIPTSSECLESPPSDVQCSFNEKKIPRVDSRGCTFYECIPKTGESRGSRPPGGTCPDITCEPGEIRICQVNPETGSQEAKCRPNPPIPGTTTDNTGTADITPPENGNYEITTEDGQIIPMDVFCGYDTEVSCSKDKKGRFKVAVSDEQKQEPLKTRFNLKKIYNELADAATTIKSIKEFEFTFLQSGGYPSTTKVLTPFDCGDVNGGSNDGGTLDDGDVDNGDVNGGTIDDGELDGCSIELTATQWTSLTPDQIKQGRVTGVELQGGTVTNCNEGEGVSGGNGNGNSVSGGSSSGGTLSGGTFTDVGFPDEFTVYPDELEVETDDVGEVFVGPTGPEPEPPPAPPAQPVKYDLVTGDKIKVGESFTARALKNDEPCVSCTIVVTDATGKEISRVTTDGKGEAVLSLANKGTYEIALLSEQGDVAKRKQVEAELAIPTPEPTPKPPVAGDQNMLLYGGILIIVVVIAYFLWSRKKGKQA